MKNTAALTATSTAGGKCGTESQPGKEAFLHTFFLKFREEWKGYEIFTRSRADEGCGPVYDPDTFSSVAYTDGAGSTGLRGQD